ncbi:hypothetical protein MRX96_033043 [Rhipicephalus microplus]
MASPSRGRAESASEVLLYVYDLSNGMVKALSPRPHRQRTFRPLAHGHRPAWHRVLLRLLGRRQLLGGEDRPRGSAPGRQPRSHRATSRRLRGVYPGPGQALEQHSVHEQQRNPQSPRPPQ